MEKPEYRWMYVYQRREIENKHKRKKIGKINFDDGTMSECGRDNIKMIS